MWAADYLAELHHRRQVTPRELPEWHYDERLAGVPRGAIRDGCDWPGSYHLYTESRDLRVARNVGLAALPPGPERSRGYAGCHSFAIAAGSRHREERRRSCGILTSFDAQLGEARRGAIPCRESALARSATKRPPWDRPRRAGGSCCPRPSTR